MTIGVVLCWIDEVARARCVTSVHLPKSFDVFFTLLFLLRFCVYLLMQVRVCVSARRFGFRSLLCGRREAHVLMPTFAHVSAVDRPLSNPFLCLFAMCTRVRVRVRVRVRIRLLQ